MLSILQAGAASFKAGPYLIPIPNPKAGPIPTTGGRGLLQGIRARVAAHQPQRARRLQARSAARRAAAGHPRALTLTLGLSRTLTLTLELTLALTLTLPLPLPLPR